MNKQFNSQTDISMTAVMLLLVCIGLTAVLANGQLYKCTIGISPSDGLGMGFINGCIICVLTFVTFIDIKTRKIPNACVLSLIGLWLISLVFQSEVTSRSRMQCQIISNVMTAAALAGAFVFTRWLANKIIKRQSLGGGDIKLAFAVGLILGPSKSVFMVLAACVLALASFVVTRIKDKGRYFPFGPAISIATGIMILYG